MAAVFDAADPVHLSFVTHAAALYAFNFGVPLPAGYDSPALLVPLLASIAVPDFVPKAVKIKANETDNTVEGADDDNDAIAALTAKLSGVASSGSLAGLAVSPADFEKVRACVVVPVRRRVGVAPRRPGVSPLPSTSPLPSPSPAG